MSRVNAIKLRAAGMPTKPRVLCDCRGEPACSPWLNLMALTSRVGRAKPTLLTRPEQWMVGVSGFKVE